MNVMGWADRQLETVGEFDALIFEGRRWSNRELHELSSRQAAALLLAGLRPGERVVLWLPNSVELVLVFTAVLRAGAVAVIISDSAPPDEVKRALYETDAAVLISAQPWNQERPALWLPVQDLMQVESLPPLLVAVPRTTEDAAQIVYTSGSSGLSKGVSWNHGVLEKRYLPFADQRPPRSPVRRSLCCLPLAGSFGAQYLYLRLLQKMQLVLLRHFQADIALEALAEHRVHTAMLVPAMGEALLAAAGPETRLPDLGSLLLGGSTVTPSLVKRLRQQLGVRASAVYGLTELGPVARTEPGDLSGRLGSTRPGLEIRIADAAPDGVGEIQVRADGDWVSTGDLGVLEAEGVRLVGRQHERIIRGGVNVYPGPLEELLLERPEVRDCAVVGVPDPYLGEEVVAWVVGESLDEQILLEHCRRHVDARRAPGRIYQRSSIPRNEGGKVQREPLRQEAARRRQEVRQTPLIRELASLSAAARRARLQDTVRQQLKALQLEVTPERTFGELGLDSLGAVQLANALSELLGRPLPATLTFQHATPEALAEFLFQSLAEAPRPQPARRPKASFRDAVAIVGAACRLPGADHPEAFWQLLREGRSSTSEVTRWNMCRYFDQRPGMAGKSVTRRAALLDADRFDAEFFGFNRQEARALDPQHRLALEVSWEALESAGLAPRSLGELRCGVFLGLSGTHWGGTDPLGRLPSMGAGRVAHLLDLRGPVLAIDTACSSGLVAVHTAVQNLRMGDCEVALAGGVNVIASPESFVALSQIGALSPDGLCKGFDAAADGFGRGEGCVMLVLKRLEEAVRDRDPILAVIRGSAVNHDGRASSLTAPHGAAQQRAARAALADADVEPWEIDFLEAHGSGTPLGDPIEMEAAMAVYGKRNDALLVGSVKSNLGHLEAAAGAVGLLKAALALRERQVPAHLHLRRLHPALEIYGDKMRVPSECVALEQAGPLRAAVTSLGMGGTNAVMILESAPPTVSSSGDSIALLAVSARTGGALEEQVERYRVALSASTERALDLGYTSTVGREHFSCRRAVVGASPKDLASALASATDHSSARSPLVPPPRLGLVFMLAGQGALYAGAGRQLFASEPVFRQALELCQTHQPGVLEALWSGEKGALAQPALFALEWSLARLWASWGVHPDLLIGHSLGEYVAACLAGLFSLQDGLRLVAARGALMAALPPGGGMLSIHASEAEVSQHLGGTGLDLAALNAPCSTVVSGPLAELERLAATLRAREVRCRLLDVPTAFHSALVEPVMDSFRSALEKVSWGTLQIPLVSTVSGHVLRDDEARSPEHWLQGLRRPVLFEAACRKALETGPNAVLEIGPQPVLTSLARQCDDLKVAVYASSLTRDRDERESLLRSLARLYENGVNPDWSGLYGDHHPRRVSLPTYSFQHTTRQMSPPAAETRSAVDLVADVLAVAPSALRRDDDLLEAGLDSLRMMQLLQSLRRHLGFRGTLGELAARPTLAGIETLLRQAGPNPTSGLITVQEGDGQGVPLVCLHPAGGQILPYLQLRSLLDPGRPIYALQSRALENPESEYPSLEAMVQGYAGLLEPARPVGLFGWSMGAVLAHAVAAVLEREGRPVAQVTMLDPPGSGWKPDLAASVLAVLHNHTTTPPGLGQIRATLESRGEHDLWRIGLEEGWFEATTVEERSFRHQVALHRRHSSMVSGYELSPIGAPVTLFWARTPAEPERWESLSRDQVRQVTLGGDHYTVVRPPRITRVAEWL